MPLTPEAIFAMPAGAELDKLVGEACAIESWELLAAGRSCFAPSSDWNDAMLAAEKFMKTRVPAERFFIEFADGLWSAGVRRLDWSWEKVGDEGASGPLAVSRAIVLLSL